MSEFDVRLFGSLHLSGRELPPSTHGRSLLAYLLVYPHQPHGRSQLAFLLNPDAPEDRARRTLSQALWEVRRILPADTIHSSGDALTLTTTSLQVDLHQFDALSLPLLTSDTLTEPQTHNLQKALALYTADLLASQYDDWLLVPREQRRERYLQMLERLAQWQKQQHQLTAALETTQRLAQADPLREATHRELMRLYVALERPLEALRQYAVCRQVLADELGLEPALETQQLAAVLRHQTPPAAVPAPYLPLQATPTPYALQETAHMPLIGRDVERQQLVQHLQLASSHGRGGIILLSGDSGIGKSRLLQEVAQDAAWRGLDVAYGHSHELAAVTPYGPLREAIAHALTPLRIKQIHSLLAPLWLSWATTLFPAIDHPPPAATDHEQGQTRLLETIVRLLLTLGELKPHLFILEDLHWADKATIDTLLYLAQRLKQTPIIMLVSFREQEARANSAVWEGLQAIDAAGPLQRLLLRPLALEQTIEFIQRGLGLTQAAPLFATRLHQEAQGSPLLLLEILRTLHDEGVLYQDKTGRWHTPYDRDTAAYEELDTAIVSDHLINRRLQQLPPDALQLLQLAAVIGREVDFSWLTAASPLPTRQTLAAVGLLVQRQFLTETAEAYRFSHDKVREAVYRSLGKMAQQTIHRQVAHMLQTAQPDTVEALAYHCQQGALWTEALVYTRQAAEQAAALYANQIALAHYHTILEILASHHPLAPDESTAVLFNTLLARQPLLWRTGQIETQEQELHQLLTLPITDPLATVQRLNQQLFFCATVRTDAAHGIPLAEAVITQAQQYGFTAEQVKAQLLLADLYNHQAQPQAAAVLYEQARQQAQTLPHNEWQTLLAMQGLIRARMELGQREDLAPLLAELITTAEQGNDPLWLAIAYGERGAFYYDLGQFAQVAADFEQALSYYQAAGALKQEASTLSNLGLVRWSLFDYAGAIEAMQDGLEAYKRLGNRRGQLYSHHNLAELYLFLGQHNTAAAHLTTGLQLAETLGQRELQTLLLYSQLEQLLQSGHTAEAQTALSQLQTIAADLALPYPLLLAAQGEGLWHSAHGRWADAAVAFERAHQHGLAAQRYWALARVLSLWAFALWRAGQTAVAQQRSREATDAQAQYGGDYSVLVYWHHYQLTQEMAFLERSYEELAQQQRALPEGDRWREPFAAVPLHRQVLDAWQAQQPQQLQVQLPRHDAPTRGKLSPEHLVTVTWTIQTAADQQLNGKQRRLAQLQRLVREAAAQGAQPTLADLAHALAVSLATIKRDIETLRQQGNYIRTRGQL